ncbi:MAG: site-specific DNA-methyltransferase, partial [Phenylobacterium sp.]|nr:site-specific DNA-methyltransferase [Phenylobacterium sp.]
IIWAKPNPMPESVTDRCTKAHEYLFLLTKSARYFWDVTAMQEAGIKGAAGSLFYAGKTADHQLGRASTKPRKQNSTNDSFVPGASEHSGLHRIGSDREPETRNRRSVWSIASQPYAGAHFAVMPQKLVEPCILAGCPVGGTVLDPFNGAATVGIVALEHGRQYLGIELNPEYVRLSVGRLTDATRQGQLFSLTPIPRPAPIAQQTPLFEAAA